MNFGGKDVLLPAAPQSPSDDRFTFTICSRRIDEVNAAIESVVKQTGRRSFIGNRDSSVFSDPVRHPYLDRTERNLGNLETRSSELTVSHVDRQSNTAAIRLLECCLA